MGTVPDLRVGVGGPCLGQDGLTLATGASHQEAG